MNKKQLRNIVNINTITAEFTLNANGLKTQLKDRLTEWIK